MESDRISGRMEKDMKEALKYLAILGKIAAVLVPVVVAALWFDAKFDDQKASADELKESIEYISVEQQFMAEDLAGIHDSLANMERDNTAQTENIKSLTWVVKNRSKYDQAQLDAIMDEMLKKNTSMQKITPEWPQWMTQQPATDLMRVK